MVSNFHNLVKKKSSHYLVKNSIQPQLKKRRRKKTLLHHVPTVAKKVFVNPKSHIANSKTEKEGGS